MVADAVLRRFSPSKWEVRRCSPGDYIADCITEDVSVVIIVDGAAVVPRVQQYITAVRAVIAALGNSRALKRVVSATYCPGAPAARARYRQRAGQVEEDLRQTGVPLVVLRSAVIVGTPRERGPSDFELFKGPRPRVFVPGTGGQVLHPIRIDDVADVIVAAATKPEATTLPGTYELGGPQPMTADDLVKTVNGETVPIRHLRSRRRRYLSRIPPLDAPIPTPSSDVKRLFGIDLCPLNAAWTAQAVTTRDQSTRNHNRAAGLSYARPRASWIGVGFFAIVGICALVIGFHDLFTVSDVGTQATSVLLIFAGAVLCFAAVALLLVRWRSRFAVGILASAVAFLIATFQLLALISSGDPRPWDPLWPLMMLFAIAIAIALWRRGGPVLKKSIGTARIRGLASVITIGAIVSALQFWYTSFYVPAAASPTVSVNADLKKVAVHGKNAVLVGTFTAHNDADVRVNVLGSVYQVTGMNAGRQSSLGGDTAEVALAHDRPAHRYTGPHDARVVAAGEVMRQGSYLEKGEEVKRSFIAYVSRKRFDAAALRVYLVFARRKLVISHASESLPRVGAHTAQVEYKQSVASPGWLRELTRGHRYVVVQEAMFDRSIHPAACYFFPTLKVYVDRQDRTPDTLPPGCDQYNRDLDEFYGVAGTTTSAEVDLSGKGRSRTTWPRTRLSRDDGD